MWSESLDLDIISISFFTILSVPYIYQIVYYGECEDACPREVINYSLGNEHNYIQLECDIDEFDI